MKSKSDPDAWLIKPQPTEELCRLFHGIDCRRGCTVPRINQCMGCQAGWPMVSGCYHRSHPEHCACILVHSVVGGYPHEIVSCTKGRY